MLALYFFWRVKAHLFDPHYLPYCKINASFALFSYAQTWHKGDGEYRPVFQMHNCNCQTPLQPPSS